MSTRRYTPEENRMKSLLLSNAHVLDTRTGEILENRHILYWSG